MPYETETTITMDEARKLSLTHILKASQGLWRFIIIADVVYLLFAIVTILLKYYPAVLICCLGIVVFTAMPFIKAYLSSTNEWKSNKLIQNATYKFKFNDNRFEVISPKGSSSIEYSALYRIIETKDRFYLYISKNQTFVIIKENCSNELIALLQEIA